MTYGRLGGRGLLRRWGVRKAEAALEFNKSLSNPGVMPGRGVAGRSGVWGVVECERECVILWCEMSAVRAGLARLDTAVTVHV